MFCRGSESRAYNSGGCLFAPSHLVMLLAGGGISFAGIAIFFAGCGRPANSATPPSSPGLRVVGAAGNLPLHLPKIDVGDLARLAHLIWAVCGQEHFFQIFYVQAARCRLALTVSFTVGSFFSRPMAARRSNAKLVVLVRGPIREWSSRNATSRIQCSEFSMLQCRRIALAKVVASGGRLVRKKRSPGGSVPFGPWDSKTITMLFKPFQSLRPCSQAGARIAR